MLESFEILDGVIKDLTPTEMAIIKRLDHLYDLGFRMKFDIRNFYDNNIFNSGAINESIKKYLSYVLYEHEFKTVTDKHRYIADLGLRTVETLTLLYRDTIHLGYYNMTGLSLHQQLSLQDNTILAEALNKLRSISEDTRAFDKIKDVNTAMDKALLSMERSPSNTIHASFFGGLASKNQFRQMYGAVGYPSNLKNEISKTPIKSSYVSGLRTTSELALNIKAAMVATFFATTAIKNSEYYSRRFQLAYSSLKWVSTEPCDTRDGFHIKHIDDGMIKGMYYRKDKEGSPWKLATDDKSTHPKVGESIILRNINYCNHERGDTVCIKCAGMLAYQKTKGHMYGNWIITKFTEINNQQSLSVKHYLASAVMAMLEELVGDSKNYFIKNNAVYVRDKVTEIHIPTTGRISKGSVFSGLDMISSGALDVDDINPENMSNIDKLVEVIKGKKVKIEYNQTGYLSKHMLKHIQKNLECTYVEDNSNITINIKGFDKSKPILNFTAISVNNKTIGEKMRNLSLWTKKNGVSKPKQVMFDEIRRLANPSLAVNYSILASIMYVFSTSTSKDEVDTTNRRLGGDVDIGMESVDTYLDKANTFDKILTGSNTTPLTVHQNRKSETSSSSISFIAGYEDAMELIDTGELRN